MKTIVTIALLFSWSLTTAILTAGFIFRDRSDATVTPSTTAALTSSELALHNGSNDCWLLINGNVYDVTNYLSHHPGGLAAIAPFCGKNASIAFRTRGGTGGHSVAAKQLLETFKLGPLE